MNKQWIDVCHKDDLYRDDVYGVKVGDRKYAIYNLSKGLYCTDGLCSHEQADLSEGYVDGKTIACPKHNATFDIKTGKALRRPACVDLQTYDIEIRNDQVFIQVPKE